jgi:PTH1 family peptidyl-tRNA hydrolase
LQNGDIVVAGLGNPGVKYRNTLHNVGFKVVDEFASVNGWAWRQEGKFCAEVSKGSLGVVYHLLKPMTFMNLSGTAVKSYLDYYQLTPDQLIVVCDDADLPLGNLRLKPKGGAGGHNGLKSLIKELGTSHFKRLRIGIGRQDGTPLAEYVLAHHNEGVWEALQRCIVQASRYLAKLSQESLEAVMKEINSGET